MPKPSNLSEAIASIFAVHMAANIATRNSHAEDSVMQDFADIADEVAKRHMKSFIELLEQVDDDFNKGKFIEFFQECTEEYINELKKREEDEAA